MLGAFLTMIGIGIMLVGANGHAYMNGKRDWPLNILIAFIGLFLFLIGAIIIG